MKLTKLAIASCVMVLSLLLSFNTHAQLSANFTSDLTSGCAPLLVNFTDQTTGNPTSWRWDLGNGTISILRNPSVVYSNAGIYTVKLVATNSSGIDSIIRTQYVHVYAKPTVAIGASGTTGCAPMTVNFTDLCSPGSGNITTWNWDFGAGALNTQQNPTFTYTSSGLYNVSLMVTNSYGCSNSTTWNNYINILSKPTANFSIGSTANCGAPLSVTFTNQSTGAGPLSYMWIFGDGTTSTQANPTHTYLNTGTFTVKLAVTNQNGCTDTLVRPNAFTIANNTTSFITPAIACANSPVSITNNTSPAPVNVSWDFGDGTSSNDFSPTKTYTTPGTYSIKMINNFGVCMDSMIRSITVMLPPTADFSGSPLTSCYAPLNVNFTNNSSGASSYQWNFGDNSTSSSINPTHTFNSQGNYTITLTAISSNGCSSTKTMNSYVNIQLPVVSIDSLPIKGCAPLTHTFQHNIIGGDAIASYQWNFGDGSTSTDQSPTHTFGVGHYDIQLIIVTNSGCTDTIRYVDGVKAGVQLNPSFSATPLNACAQIPVTFTDSTVPANLADQWYWSFGDSTSSTQQNPRHTYVDTGYMNVMLVVYNDGCADTLIKENYVHIGAPISNFIVEKNCRERLKRIFHDRSTAADSWYWNFGDGNTSTDQSPTHVYGSSGIYTVSLTTHNNTTGCDHTKITSITVVNQRPDILASDTVICRGNTIAFSATGINPAFFTTFRWNFGDNTSGTGNPINKTYYLPGMYNTTLISTDKNNCRDTVFKPRYITVNGPTAYFNQAVTSICSGGIVHFRDSSSTDGRNSISHYIWNFGDGQSDTTRSRSISHIYNNGGTYSVTLKVVDSNGCAHSYTRNNLITVFHPSADFSTSDSIGCPNSAINFSNSSIGSGLTYQWNFGDGTTSTDRAPSHAYASNGAFTVRLIVTDQNGCSDTLTRTNYIQILTPVAQFSVSDTLGTCPPLIVNFTNQSGSYTNIMWNFGDGTTSTLVNPSHFYGVSGNFTAQLTITGPGGCVSTNTANITVKGPRGTFNYGDLQGCAPKGVNFTSNAIGASIYIWDFNDGTTDVGTNANILHNYVSIGNFIPKLILKDSAGCTVPLLGTDTISTYGANAGIQFDAATFCDRGSVQFNNTSTGNDVITSYDWDFGNGIHNSSENPVYQYDTAGSYFPVLIVESQHGCRDTVRSAYPVKIVTSPQPVISQTANGCVPVTVSFNATLAIADTSAISWNWTLGNGNSSTLTSPVPQIYNTAGNYTVRLTASNSSGCTGSDTAHVEAFAIPVVDAGQDTLVCKGSGSRLSATGANTYVWSPSTGLSCTDCTNPIASPVNNITYQVVGRSVNGCTSSDSVKVYVKVPFRMVTSTKDSICLGASKRITASGAANYEWYPSTGLDNPHISSPIATPTASIQYMVVGTDDKGCFKDTAYIPMIVHHNPTVDAGADKSVNVGQSVTLTPRFSPDVSNVVWSPTGSIFMSAPPSITVKPNQTTTYTVQVFNRGGCTAADQLTVNVLCNNANLYIPNTFSPNNDGMNDLFYPRGNGIFTIRQIKIFTRWGEVVFEKNNFNPNDASKAWDGTFKGRKLNPDVFVYVVDVVCDNDNMLTFKGNVALIK